MAPNVSWPANLFGKSWDELELADVERFLRGLRLKDEGLTWEAKAGTIHPGDVHQAVAAFGNSVLGGYLILGAAWDKAAHTWKLPGIEIPGDEPLTWLGQVAHAVRGVPPVELKAWAHGVGHVALIAVSPAPIPPVIAPSGIVYERVSGASVPVKDPVELRRLFERGEAAQARAINEAEQARHLVTDASEGRFANVVIGMGSVGVAQDITHRLFTVAVRSSIGAVVQEQSLVPPDRVGIAAETSRIAMRVRDTGWGSSEWNVVASATTTGGVGVAWFLNEEIDAVSNQVTKPDLIDRAWQVGHTALVAVGASGPEYMAVYLHSTRGSHSFRGWTRGVGPTEEELAMIVRQIRRSRGDYVLEDGA